MTIHPERRMQDGMLGRVLLGRYRIVRELARGGMGIVYLARAEGAAGFVKPVVIKLILREYADDKRFLGMFEREAKILASLRDPGIVDVLEFGEDHGDHVMVLEYVRGYHLGQWKRYLGTVGREVPTDVMLQIGIDVLTALHHAHNAKHPDGRPMHITHRDVSPSNILLDGNGRPRLLDFGVARMRGGTQAYKTQVKSVVGKAPYLSPELLSGEDATPQSDLYACAVVIHETLFGKNVFRGDNEAMTLYRVLNHTPEPVSQVRPDAPVGLDAVLAKALAKSPAERYKTAEEFARALRGLQTQPEHDVRERLAQLLEEDFSEAMAAVLGIESLATRDEAWSRQSQLPVAADAIDPDTTAGVPALDTRRKSRIPPPPPAVKLPPMPDSGIEGTNLSPTPAQERSPLTLSRPASADSSGRTVLIVAATLAIAAGAFVTQRMLHGDGGEAGASAAPIQVVQTSLPEETPPLAEPAPEPPEVEPTPEPEAALPEVDEPAPEDQEPPHRPKRRDRRKAEKRGPDAAALTRAFRRKQGSVQRCFGEHSEEAKTHPRVEVEFSIDARGSIKRTKLSPASVGDTALGRCITRIAQSTHFPPQGQPLVFAIPVTARAVQ